MTRTAHVISEGRILNESGTIPPFSEDLDGIVLGPSADDIANNRILRADNTFVDQDSGGDVLSPDNPTEVNELFKSANTAGNQLDLTNLFCRVSGALDYPPQSTTGWVEGRVYYDSDDKALTYFNEESAVSIQLGQEMVLRALNTSGGTLQNGTVVRITGATAGLPTVGPAQADDPANANPVGVTTHQAGTSSTVYVCTAGVVKGFDTSAWSAGNVLYLDDAAPGQLTNIEPALSVPIAWALDSNVFGSIFVGGFPEREAALDITAADVTFTPAGDLAATDVQAALEELDAEKSPTTHNHDADYQPKGELTAINAQSGTSYTLQTTDAGALVECTNAAAVTVTIPTNATDAIPIGSIIHLAQGGAGKVTIGGAGITVLVGATFLKSTLEQDALITLLKTGTDTWRLGGMLEAA